MLPFKDVANGDKRRLDPTHHVVRSFQAMETPSCPTADHIDVRRGRNIVCRRMLGSADPTDVGRCARCLSANRRAELFVGVAELESWGDARFLHGCDSAQCSSNALCAGSDVQLTLLCWVRVDDRLRTRCTCACGSGGVRTSADSGGYDRRLMRTWRTDWKATVSVVAWDASQHGC